jgi:hypothetical protein
VTGSKDPGNPKNSDKNMTQFEAFVPEMEVNGQTVLSIVDGLGIHVKQAYEILSQNGINDPQPDQWYSQQSWLDAFREIALKLGPELLFKIGRQIPGDADWPSRIKTMEDALASIDVAYHMNHRLKGEILYNSRSGKMQEGIGHYRYEPAGPRSARMVCLNPYPCEFDRGIIEATMLRYKDQGAGDISVIHEAPGPCRDQGGESCSYLVKW